MSSASVINVSGPLPQSVSPQLYPFSGNVEIYIKYYYSLGIPSILLQSAVI
jgi:hypothetical protein